MVTIQNVLNTGGKKYLPASDYVAQVALCQLVKANGKGRIKMALKIVDTLPEGGMDDLATSLGDNEKFPGDERLWFDIWLPTPEQKDGGAFCTENLANCMVAFGILATDEEGGLHFDDANPENEGIDLADEVSAEWFDGRYVGIQLKKQHHFSNIDKKTKSVIDPNKPKEDAITRLIALPENA